MTSSNNKCNDSQSLPFQQLESDEYNEMVQNNQGNACNISEISHRVRNLLFNPLILNDDRFKTDLTAGQDPDQHYSNAMIENLISCDYFLENQVNNIESIKQKAFSLLHWNIRSLNNKFNDISEYIRSLNHDFSVIGLSETWLNDISEKYFDLPNYSFISKTRNNKHGGGVGMYISNTLDFKVRDDLSTFHEEILESLFIELRFKGKKSKIVGVIYRPPNNTFNKFEENLTKTLECLNNEGKETYLIGDYNLDILKFNDSVFINDFISLMYAPSFFPTITKPTRITDKSAASIDNIFINSPNKNSKRGILISDLSDHLPIFYITMDKLDTKHAPIEQNIRIINKKILKKLKDE